MKEYPDDIKKLIRSVTWTFAETIPEWPHEYIVRNKVDEELFVQMAHHIRTFGYPGKFYTKEITYFEEDGLIYWTMGNPIEETTIINRTQKENSFEERMKKGTLP